MNIPESQSSQFSLRSTLYILLIILNLAFLSYLIINLLGDDSSTTLNSDFFPIISCITQITLVSAVWFNQKYKATGSSNKRFYTLYKISIFLCAGSFILNMWLLLS